MMTIANIPKLPILHFLINLSEDLLQNGIHPKATRPIFQLKTGSFELNIGLTWFITWPGICWEMCLPHPPLWGGLSLVQPM